MHLPVYSVRYPWYNISRCFLTFRSVMKFCDLNHFASVHVDIISEQFHIDRTSGYVNACM